MKGGKQAIKTEHIGYDIHGFYLEAITADEAIENFKELEKE